jgi:glycerol dehydrogenase-like iron-containing ADH family enzyme
MKSRLIRDIEAATGGRLVAKNPVSLYVAGVGDALGDRYARPDWGALLSYVASVPSPSVPRSSADDVAALMRRGAA